MRSTKQDRTKLTSYAVLIAFCIFALAMALLNGFYRGHWFKFGFFADTIGGLSMGSLYLRSRRNFKG